MFEFSSCILQELVKLVPFSVVDRSGPRLFYAAHFFLGAQHFRGSDALSRENFLPVLWGHPQFILAARHWSGGFVLFQSKSQCVITIPTNRKRQTFGGNGIVAKLNGIGSYLYIAKAHTLFHSYWRTKGRCDWFSE